MDARARSHPKIGVRASTRPPHLQLHDVGVAREVAHDGDLVPQPVQDVGSVALLHEAHHVDRLRGDGKSKEGMGVTWGQAHASMPRLTRCIPLQ